MPSVSLDRFRGSLLGLALGDALGAPHEGGVLERLVWLAVGRTREGERRWTDDTQMTLDLVKSLVAVGELDQDDIARRFANSYRWSRGYGPGTAKVLKRIAEGASWEAASRSVHSAGSLGNGGAMRAPAVGLFCAHHGGDVEDMARSTAAVTHAHPLAKEGAAIIARATAEAALGRSAGEIFKAVESVATLEPFRDRVAQVRRLQADQHRRLADAARTLGNGMKAVDSCVTAVFIGLAHLEHPFDELMRTAIATRGDVDTIAAMAGAVWGAANGVDALPEADLEKLEARYEIDAAARDLHGFAPSSAARSDAPKGPSEDPSKDAA